MTVLAVSNGLLFIIYIKSKKVTYAHTYILVATLIFLSVSFCSALLNQSPTEIINSLQFLFCIGFGLYISTISWTKQKIHSVYYLVIIFVSFHLVVWIISGAPQLFTSIYPNSNTFGPFMFLSLFFILLKIQYGKKNFIDIGLIVSIAVLIFASDARSVLISALVGGVIFLFWNQLTRNRFIGTVFYLFFSLVILSMIFIYPRLPEWEYFYILKNGC